MDGGVTMHDLGAIALFAGLDPTLVAAAVSVARWEHRAGGQTLIHQGQPGDVVYVLVDGEAEVTIDGQSIDPNVAPGECVGELAVLDGAPRAATVTTTRPTRLIAFDAGEFHDLVHQSPILRQRLTRSLVQRLRQVSHGWIRLAADTELLLEACLALQDDHPADRDGAIARAADVIRYLTPTVRDSAPIDDGSDGDLGDSLETLTPAERRVADLVAVGLSNVAIGERLFISRHTVESHLKHIYTKLHIHSRVALAALVLRAA